MAKHVLTLSLFLLCPPGAFATAPAQFAGSFVFAGGDAEQQPHRDSVAELRDAERATLPHAAEISNTLDISADASVLTIRTSTSAWAGPSDGTQFILKDVGGKDVQVTRTVSTADGLPAIIEEWKVPQPKLGRSRVRALVQSTTYALSADGTTLTIKVHVDGGRLRNPLDYALTYRRQ